MLTILSVPANVTTDAETFTVSGKATGTWVVGQTVTVTVGDEGGTAEVAPNGTWSVEFDVADFGTGEHAVTVTLSDSNGRAATALSRTVTVS